MSSYFTLIDDMDQLKAQMNILMSHLKQNEIITDEMVRRSVQKRMNHLIPSRIMEIVSYVVSLAVIPGIFVTGYIMQATVLHSSLLFTIATVMICWCGALITYFSKYNDIRKVCKNGSLTDVATKVAKMRRNNAIFSVITPVFILIYVTIYIHVGYSVLLNEHNGLFISVLIIGFVTFSGIYRNIRVNRITSEILDEIDDLKKKQ